MGSFKEPSVFIDALVALSLICVLLIIDVVVVELRNYDVGNNEEGFTNYFSFIGPSYTINLHKHFSFKQR